MLTTIFEISCLSLAVSSGIFTMNRMTPFFRILALQVIVWGVFYGLLHTITLYQQSQNQPIDNQWLMNIHLILETGLLLAAARSSFTNKGGKRLVMGAAIFFLSVFVVQGWKQGFDDYLNYADVAACLGITLVFSLVLFNFSQQSTEKWWLSPEKLACVGILLYFACSVPYVSMMNYLQVKAPAVNSFLYHLISDILANIRYLLTAISFWMVYRNTKKQLTKA